MVLSTNMQNGEVEPDHDKSSATDVIADIIRQVCDNDVDQLLDKLFPACVQCNERVPASLYDCCSVCARMYCKSRCGVKICHVCKNDICEWCVRECVNCTEVHCSGCHTRDKCRCGRVTYRCPSVYTWPSKCYTCYENFYKFHE